MLEYKIDVLKELKEVGWNATRLIKERPISQGAVQQLREKKMVGMKSLDVICRLLDLQPGNIIRYVPDETK